MPSSGISFYLSQMPQSPSGLREASGCSSLLLLYIPPSPIMEACGQDPTWYSHALPLGEGYGFLLSQQQGSIFIYFYYIKRILFLFFSISFDLGPVLAPVLLNFLTLSCQGTLFLQKPTLKSSIVTRMMSPAVFPGCLTCHQGGWLQQPQGTPSTGVSMFQTDFQAPCSG